MPAEIRHVEHLSAAPPAGRERRANLLAPNTQVGVLDDVLRRVFAGRGLEVRGPLRAFAEPLLTPDGVDGTMVHQREEEGAEGPVRASKASGARHRARKASWTTSCAMTSCEVTRSATP